MRERKADGSAGDGEIGGDKAQNFAKGDGGKREVRSAQSKNDLADNRCKDRCQQWRKDEGDPVGNAVRRGNCQSVRAQSEERGMS